MKTVSMWSYSNGAREIDIHEVEPEIFEKLSPVFDLTAGQLDRVGYLVVDANTKIIFYKKQDDGKEESNEVPVENAEGE